MFSAYKKKQLKLFTAFLYWKTKINFISEDTRKDWSLFVLKQKKKQEFFIINYSAYILEMLNLLQWAARIKIHILIIYSAFPAAPAFPASDTSSCSPAPALLLLPLVPCYAPSPALPPASDLNQ